MTGMSRARITALWREWATPPPRLRPVVVTLLAAGIVLAVLGLVGDVTGVWSRFPFLTNLASTLTGALFGLPVALVVVQRLLQAQSEANDRAGAWRLALRSAHSMRVAAVSLSGVDAGGAAAELDRLAARCDVAVAEAGEWVDRAFAARARPRRLRASMYQRAYLRQVVTLHRTVQQAADVFATTGMGAGTAAAALERLRSEAAFLHDHIRPMVLRLDGRWLPQPHARILEGGFPAEFPPAGVRQLLDALPVAEFAALLPEPDAARAGLTDPGLPMPLPPMDQLRELRGGVGTLIAQLAQARHMTREVDGVHDAVDRLAD